MSDSEGRPNKRFLELYRQLAKGNIGIIISGYAYVMPNGKSNPGQSGIYNDDLIPAWQEVSKIVKGSGSLFLLQIVHGGRQVRPKSNPGPIWAPSAVPDPVFKTQPLEMTEKEIKEVTNAFIQAAGRAKEAGFDGIQLHVAHGYLLSQFLSPYTNRRQDQYGGNQENRTRIVVEIIKGIKDNLEDQFLLSAKINGEDFLPGGLTLNQAIESAKFMKQAGLDFIEISGGMAESKNGAVRRDITTPGQEGYFREHAKEVKRKAKISTASVGGYRSLEYITDTLNSENADFISLCRPFIREPELLLKFENGESLKAACVSCNRCFNPKGLRCWHEA
jgi:2,4-dienoyl-CoA reductase-like NADH-dependent reductase (Old Yellow Enzyme family)